LALLGALLPEAAPDDAATLFASLAPSWRECTDQAEIAEVARVLEDNATFVEDPVVFFGFSFLHHACVPNAALLMDVGPDVSLVSLTEVPADTTLTVDKLRMPIVYSPAWVRSERLCEMGITCTCRLCTGVQPEVMRVFMCPKCNAAEFCPTCPSRTSELGQLKCLACGHDGTEEERRACAEAEERFDAEPSILTSPTDRLSELHWLNVKLAYDYLYEIAPLQEPTLQRYHRSLVHVLFGAVARLDRGAEPTTLRDLYQVDSDLCVYDLDSQRSTLERFAELRKTFFPREVAKEAEIDRKLFGPDYDAPGDESPASSSPPEA
jgi:hypothetical protein